MQKKALVTGSSSGIGKAIALDLASKGFDVAFHYNSSEEKAKKNCQEAEALGVKAIALQADVTKPEKAKSLVDDAATQLGGLSVVVNVVGNFLYKLTSEVSVEEWQEVLDSNLNSTFYITQTALPYLKAAKWGRIINFACASAHHVTAREKDAPYLIAKTGIIIYTKSIAQELAKDKITANIIAPGVAENSIGLEETVPTLPMKRPATLEEMNNAVWFFVNPEAEYITGQVLEVSGGWKL
jgi:NAD(P)-dependent dehydrogenase (short-subunit alcohol dehydrogenase family)